MTVVRHDWIAAGVLFGCAGCAGPSAGPAPIVDVPSCVLIRPAPDCAGLDLPPATHSGATTSARALADYAGAAYHAWSACAAEVEGWRGSADVLDACKAQEDSQ